jgi:hypothetical protein
MHGHVTLPVHGAVEIAVGTALMAAPFVLGMSAAAMVTAVLIGALIVGLALAGSGSEGRGTIPVSAHAAYDSGLALGLVAAGVLLGIAGDMVALGILAAAGLVQAALRISTRYVVARA